MARGDHNYLLFGIRCRSQIPLPCQPQVLDHADVVIEYGTVDIDWAEPHYLSSPGITFQARPHQMVITVQGVGQYWIQQGQSITVHPYPDTSEDLIQLFLLGPVLGGLLHQRGLLVLHGSGIQVGRTAILFLGPSGAGKSTLAAGLVKQGYPLVADDLAVIHVDTTGMRIYPGLPRIKLWQDSCLQLDYIPAELTPVQPQADKFVIPSSVSTEAESLSIGRIYSLEPEDQAEVAIIPLHGSSRVMTLVENTYRRQYLKGIGFATDHFMLCLQVAKYTSIHRVLRPQSGFQLSSLIASIQRDLQSMEQHTWG